MLNKKAEELALRTIVLWIIALLVLIVVIILFQSQFGQLANAFSNLIKIALT